MPHDGHYLQSPLQRLRTTSACFENVIQFCVSKFSEPNQAREGKHFKMGWITTRILHLSDPGAAITMALTAKLYDIAPAQRKAGSSQGLLSG